MRLPDAGNKRKAGRNRHGAIRSRRPAEGRSGQYYGSRASPISVMPTSSCALTCRTAVAPKCADERRGRRENPRDGPPQVWNTNGSKPLEYARRHGGERRGANPQARMVGLSPPPNALARGNTKFKISLSPRVPTICCSWEMAPHPWTPLRSLAEPNSPVAATNNARPRPCDTAQFPTLCELVQTCAL